MGLANLLAPLVTEHLGGSYEKRPEVAQVRQKLLAPAAGRVLEVGAGTGFNLPHYPDAVSELVLADRLDGMLVRARKRADATGRGVSVTTTAVESLPYADASFDTIVASFVLCSVDDEDPALAEMRRVLRPGGRYLFLEHVRADEPKLARAQDRIEPVWKVVLFGCHPNRETLGHIEAAFEVEEAERESMTFGPKVVRPYVVGRARKP
jgi:ubiquinone/menaquinone biosynthesis C-methylase UbiE